MSISQPKEEKQEANPDEEGGNKIRLFWHLKKYINFALFIHKSIFRILIVLSGTQGEGESNVWKIEALNAIKHEKGDSLDFLTTPSTPWKEFGQNPKDLPHCISNYCASMIWYLKFYFTNKTLCLV